MKHTVIALFIALILCWPALVSAELTMPSRFDISMKPYKFGLQGDLKRAIDDYRVAVNQTGIEPSEERQIRAEILRLEQLLRSRGYYLATISGEYPPDGNRPTYQISLGKQFKINTISVSGDVIPEDPSWQSLEEGDPLNAVMVMAQQNELKKYVEKSECYFQVDVTHQVQLNTETQTADLELITQASIPATFKAIEFEGADGVNHSFLRRVIGISTGECYRRLTIDNAVISLFDTGLFSQVSPNVLMTETGKVNVKFVVSTRKERTLSAAIGWRSEQGFGGRFGWQHRNLFGSAQALSLGLDLQTNLQTLSSDVVIPSFFSRTNRFNWENTIEHSDFDIEAYRYSTEVRVERKASRRDYFEFGLGFSQIDERTVEFDDEEDLDWDRYRQIRLPLVYRYDSVKDPFNPKAGIRYSATVEPVWDIDDDLTPFLLTGVGVQSFIGDADRATIASRVNWDSLWFGEELGSDLDNIPESEWLTAGGSSSVRGYAYQSIKQNRDDSEPAGSAQQRWVMVNELRLQLSDSWGLVTFWDVAAISSQWNPLEQNQWYHGAGAGVRYFTRFAPLRFDVAIPLTQRPDNENFLVYVSLGQAF